MVTCRKCGSRLKDSVKFCKSCGTPVLPAPAESPEIRAKRQTYAARITAAPNAVEPLLEFAEYLEDIDQIGEAVEFLERAVRIGPNNAIVRGSVPSCISGCNPTTTPPP